jgi:hypothetical protein
LPIKKSRYDESRRGLPANRGYGGRRSFAGSSCMGLGPSELRRLRQLEEENRELKKLVADLSLDKRMLQEVLSKSLAPGPRRELDRYVQHEANEEDVPRCSSSARRIATDQRAQTKPITDAHPRDCRSACALQLSTGPRLASTDEWCAVRDLEPSRSTAARCHRFDQGPGKRCSDVHWRRQRFGPKLTIAGALRSCLSARRICIPNQTPRGLQEDFIFVVNEFDRPIEQSRHSRRRTADAS